MTLRKWCRTRGVRVWGERRSDALHVVATVPQYPQFHNAHRLSFTAPLHNELQVAHAASHPSMSTLPPPTAALLPSAEAEASVLSLANQLDRVPATAQIGDARTSLKKAITENEVSLVAWRYTDILRLACMK